MPTPPATLALTTIPGWKLTKDDNTITATYHNNYTPLQVSPHAILNDHSLLYNPLNDTIEFTIEYIDNTYFLPHNNAIDEIPETTTDNTEVNASIKIIAERLFNTLNQDRLNTLATNSHIPDNTPLDTYNGYREFTTAIVTNPDNTPLDTDTIINTLYEPTNRLPDELEYATMMACSNCDHAWWELHEHSDTTPLNNPQTHCPACRTIAFQETHIGYTIPLTAFHKPTQINTPAPVAPHNPPSAYK